MAQNNRKIFKGNFDLFICEQFREKRHSLGISLKQLGEFLKIHWTTVRKWEAGLITACHPCHISTIDSFLNGDYDSALQIMFGRDLFHLQGQDGQTLADQPGAMLPAQLQCLMRLELISVLSRVLTKFQQQLGGAKELAATSDCGKKAR